MAHHPAFIARGSLKAESLRLGEEHLAARAGEYRGGWDTVLGRYQGVFGEVEVG